MAMLILNLAAGAAIPSHSHKGVVFAYVLQGEIENQIEPAEPRIYHPGDFFQENANQVHRLMRNLNKTEPARILILQNASYAAALVEHPLSELSNQEVSMIKMRVAPGATGSEPHQHSGPVFAFVVKGEVESQADPGPAEVHRAGDAFYEPPMRANRHFRNLSETESAELIVFEVSDAAVPGAGVGK
jgi:quercetin dioxygenase-like cupin family protein